MLIDLEQKDVGVLVGSGLSYNKYETSESRVNTLFHTGEVVLTWFREGTVLGH